MDNQKVRGHSRGSMLELRLQLANIPGWCLCRERLKEAADISVVEC